MKNNLLGYNPKRYMLGLLAVLAVIGMFQHGLSATLPQMMIAVLTATLIDISIGYKKNGKIAFPQSAFITGMIIGMVLSPGVRWYIPLAASSAAIIQKHLIRYKGRHIFNPANLGLLSTMFIFSAYTTWWGQSFWPLIVAVGLFVCYRMQRLHIPLVFISTFFIIFALENAVAKAPIFDSLFLVNLFFVFVMLIEPKTTPRSRIGQYIYAVSAAAFSFMFFKFAPQHDFSVLTLASANLLTPLLNNIK
ncbi:MAG: RnfABCDGE type electron transport complex subunit D [Candidatus Omnitrophica bacterium]|nr:RnfABCDGE type electron transport complex subunit D [Candidatus Omnitrophota bacterium]